MEYMVLPLKRYADFKGRSRRLEYWMFFLLLAIVTIAWFGIFTLLAGEVYGEDISLPTIIWIFAGIAAYLAVIVPCFAVQVRRLHDRDYSGWFVLLNLIPYVGGIIVFVLMVLPGTEGANKYGPDPKDPTNLGLAE